MKFKDFFFGELTYIGVTDIIFKLLVWGAFIILTIWFIRMIINWKTIRHTHISYKEKKYYLVRDLFLRFTAMECLIIFMITFAIYAGFWAWTIRLENYNGTKWQTYIGALPQILTFLGIIIMFFTRYNKFRKPLK